MTIDLDHLARLASAAAVTSPWKLEEFGGDIYSNAGLAGGSSMTPGSFKVLEVRGWGHLQYRPDGEAIQDAIGKLVAAAHPAVVSALVNVARAAKEVAEFKEDVHTGNAVRYARLVIAMREALAALDSTLP